VPNSSLVYLHLLAYLPPPPSFTPLHRVAVKGIKKQNLTEMRALANPPNAVKLALESVCTLLGEKDVDWKSLRALMMKDNFISNIVNFNTESIT